VTNEFLTFSEAAKAIEGRVVHPETIRRWVVNGVIVNGVPVRLFAKRIAGRSFTKREWVEAFVRECSGGTEPASSPRRTGGVSAARRRLLHRGVYVSKQRTMCALQKGRQEG
jgi:hypothetical protein